MKIKLCLLMMAFAFTHLDVLAADGILLRLKSGKTVGFAFDSKPKVITGKTLVLKSSDGNRVEYNYDEVSKLYWGNVSSSVGIDNVQVDTKSKVVFHLTHDGITVTGLQKGEHVTAYTIGGVQVGQAVSTTNDSSVSISLSFTNEKVLIVRTSGGTNFKFVKP